MRTIALLLLLVLTPLAARAGDKFTFPLHCAGNMGAGSGKAQINGKGDALGSAKFPVAAPTDYALMCQLACAGTTYTPVSCGFIQAGHKSFKFKATGLLLAAGVPEQCRAPEIVVGAPGAIGNPYCQMWWFRP